MVAYGYADTNPRAFEEDHLIPLELGGESSDRRNLWPEPHAGVYGSYAKNRVENYLHRLVCSGAMTSESAQTGIATDWRQYLSPTTRGHKK